MSKQRKWLIYSCLLLVAWGICLLQQFLYNLLAKETWASYAVSSSLTEFRIVIAIVVLACISEATDKSCGPNALIRMGYALATGAVITVFTTCMSSLQYPGVEVIVILSTLPLVFATAIAGTRLEWPVAACRASVRLTFSKTGLRTFVACILIFGLSFPIYREIKAVFSPEYAEVARDSVTATVLTAISMIIAVTVWSRLGRGVDAAQPSRVAGNNPKM